MKEEKMKRVLKIWITIAMVMVLMTGCGGNSNSKLCGAWYETGEEDATFILYDDGTCEIAGEYGTGTWTVVNGNTLKLSNYYGETMTASIVSVTKKCLTLESEGDQIQLWSSVQTNN